MKLFKIFIFIYFLLVPSVVFAWGPLTHIYLGNELLTLGPLLPAGLFEIIRRYRKDFLYGNIMADIIVGKKYLPDHKNSHNWNVGFQLLKSAETRQQKAFVYGYMCHLAADTVAHNVYTADRKNIGHTLFELKADCIIDKKFWFQIIEMDRTIQKRNDAFLESSLDRFIFSFKTNKRILKSMVFLSVFNRKKLGDFIDRNLITPLPTRKTIERLQDESLDRILDLFKKWEKSDAVKENPNGINHNGGLLHKDLIAFLIKQDKTGLQK
ncbi:MAG: zinc dependent phospholipase C family protein [Nitrospirota bacterium]